MIFYLLSENLYTHGRCTGTPGVMVMSCTVVVGPVEKIKTGFRSFETKRNPGFRKCTDI